MPSSSQINCPSSVSDSSTSCPSTLICNKTKYFTVDEVVIHNKPTDFWVIIHGWVLDLSKLFEKRRCSMNVTMDFFLKFGGKDLSSFFHDYARPKTRLTQKGNLVPVFPPVLEPTDPYNLSACFWWHDQDFVIGKITKRPRKLRIINTLLATTQLMTVCEEDTIDDIQEKYRRYNWHYEGYSWRKFDCKRKKYLGLCLDNTLTENGFLHDPFGAPPALWLKYKEDGTVA